MELIQIIKNVHSRYNGNLIYYYQKLMKASNVYVHYHNVRHMLHVLWEAYDGGVHMGLNSVDMRIVLISSMYHDFDHTGKKNLRGDIENIERAIAALRRDILPEDRPFLYRIEYAIRMTEFPYKNETPDMVSMILRDADMSQTFSPVWIQSILFDLGKEMEMSYEEMLNMQIPFMEKQKFYTTWGQFKFEPLKIQRMNVIKQMVELMNTEI